MGDLAHPLPGSPAGSAPAANRKERSFLVRLSALSALSLVLAGVASVGNAAYRAMSDSFVAPMSLSPDSEVVLGNKMKLTELELERARAVVDADAAAAELTDAEAEIVGLDGLRRTVAAAVPWTQLLHEQEAFAGAAELDTIARRQVVLARMIVKQRKLTEAGLQNLEAGIINQADYEREEQKLDQLKLSSLETARARLASEFNVRKVRLGQPSLAGGQGAPPMPETVAREDLAVRVELQLLRLEAKKRAKLAEKNALLQRVGKIDELITQLKGRPLFHAADTQLDVAFVPYSQLDGVIAGAQVIRCTLVVFGCRVVGAVSEVIPGEVVLPDPWGSTERGQYAVLSLGDRTAARAKTLRVRASRASLGAR